jgi:hypothetical protein
MLQYREEVRFRKVSAKELKRVCKDALDELGWNWQADDRWRLVADVPRTFSSFGEWLVVEIYDEELVVLSHCRVRNQLVDWGKNRKNVERFLDRVEVILYDELRT